MPLKPSRVWSSPSYYHSVNGVINSPFYEILLKHIIVVTYKECNSSMTTLDQA